LYLYSILLFTNLDKEKMKIVLRAFNNKLQGVMEVPENTTPRFKLALEQPIQIANFGFTKKDNFNLMKSPIKTICVFEWTGGTFVEEGHEFNGAREYQLVDIEKL